MYLELSKDTYSTLVVERPKWGNRVGCGDSNKKSKNKKDLHFDFCFVLLGECQVKKNC
jgi:hypothetical protein